MYVQTDSLVHDKQNAGHAETKCEKPTDEDKHGLQKVCEFLRQNRELPCLANADSFVFPCLVFSISLRHRCCSTSFHSEDLETGGLAAVR